MDITKQTPDLESDSAVTFCVHSPTDEVLSALDTGQSLDQLVTNYETAIIERTLDRCDGNKAKAARLLKVQANNLHYKLLRYKALSDTIDYHGHA